MLSVANVNLQKYLQKYEAQKIYVPKSDYKNEIITIGNNLSNLSEKVETNENDISDLDERTTTNENDITTINNTISNIPINPYEGLFKPIYISSNRPGLEFNYNTGKLIYWSSGEYWKASLNNMDENYNLNDGIKNITLPGTIKQINADKTINQIINKILYAIDNPTNDRKTLSNLKIVNVLPDVSTINFNLSGAPNLLSLNLFNGLEKITLSNAYNLQTLIIPASVTEANISNSIFMNLIFEDSNLELKLTYTDNRINNKLKIMRKLSNDSNISVSENSTIDYPPSVLECDLRILNKLGGNSCLSNGYTTITDFTTLILRLMAFDNQAVYHAGISSPLKFYRIFVMCQLQINGINNLSASEWFNVYSPTS